MDIDEMYMKRCFDLAASGLGNASPNPLVGSVVVCDGKIIGEGYHRRYGEAHAEVNAIASVKQPALLRRSVLYVNLEPCAHYGKTPPCADLIVRKKIPRVVIGCLDSFEAVSGRGIEILKTGGCRVKIGVLEKEARKLNRRFFTFHEKKRPYIILKWAQTLDGYIDAVRPANAPLQPFWITNPQAKRLVHRWRAEEDGIMVGTATAAKDNPALNVRLWTGKDPLRVFFDRNLNLSLQLKLFDGSVPTLVFTQKKHAPLPGVEFVPLDFSQPSFDVVRQALKVLFEKKVQSLIVEGGAQLLESFLGQNLWDEIRLFTGNKFFGNGVKAPKVEHKPNQHFSLGNSNLFFFRNPDSQ